MAGVLALAVAVPFVSGSTAETGTLALRAVFGMDSRRGDCPPGTRSSIECFSRTGTGVVAGLGNASESYLYVVEMRPVACPDGDFRVLGSTARLTVAGKGQIDVSLGGVPDCLNIGNVLTPSRAFTVTGGSGAYAEASGSGTLKHAAYTTETGAAGTDTWIGTLVVPGLDFDVTAPTLSGAVSKTVRSPRGSKSVRVTFKVTAKDDVDGSLPVTCTPRSGSRFKIGKTRVTCSATDTSGNTKTAKFRVTVKAR